MAEISQKESDTMAENHGFSLGNHQKESDEYLYIIYIYYILYILLVKRK